MRQIVAGLFVSVDGVVESPEEWTGPYFSDEIGQAIGALISAGDTLLLGRRTYQTFAASFAGETGGMADQMNAISKFVVSSTLDKAEWQNTTLLNEDIAKKIAELKELPGQNINVSGSATLVGWLLDEGLLDELDLLVFPCVVGSGKRLFESGGTRVELKLASSDAFSTGVVHLNYRPTNG